MGTVVDSFIVTGARGFLGHRLTAHLSAAGHRVFAVDRQPVLARAPRGVIQHVSDLTDPATLLPPRKRHGKFVLIHLAWDMRYREKFYAVQTGQVKVLAGLLDHWQDKGLQYVVAPGSAQEYGAQDGVLKEDDPFIPPLSPYGWAKRSACELAMGWSKWTGHGVCWLRPFIVYGPGQGGDMLIPYAVKTALEGRPAAFTAGSQVRDFVFVDDVVRAISMAAEKRPSGVNVVNLGSNDPVKVRTVLEEIGRQFDCLDQFTFGKLPLRPGEPPRQIADVHRAAKVLGWKPTLGWKAGIARTCSEWQGGVTK